MKRKALTEKILCLGVDGLDPRLTRKYVGEGKMPNMKKFIERGACREDLVLLGGQPTVTPPMWTTLATGAYPNVHGITGFYRASKQGLDYLEYNVDSRNCKAEQIWNCFAEAGKKTLVWHWPGSAWPPSSDNENLLVVDGTAPGSVNGGAQVEPEFIVGANIEIKELTYLPKVAADSSAACVIDNLSVDRNIDPKTAKGLTFFASMPPKKSLIVDSMNEGTMGSHRIGFNVVQSPVKPASGWANAPEGAMEFVILFSRGLIRRPSLILKNEKGIYDKVAVYKSKKDTEPLVVLSKNKLERNVLDEAIVDDKRIISNRNMKVIELAEDGSQVKIWVSAANDISSNEFWHPRSLYNLISENVGYPPPTVASGSHDLSIFGCMLDSWYSIADWQAGSLKYMMDEQNVEAVFSHFHGVDLQVHRFVRYMYDKGQNKHPVEVYYKMMEDVYILTDYYLGQFLKYLDEGWTILIFSDHALVCSRYNPPGIGDAIGINIELMKKLGFTVLKKDENGNEIKEIDWEKTKAVCLNENHIYINLKGRDEHGIVDPKDKYELEEEIMTALYGYKHPESGKRVIAAALRNRDAVLLGQGGPEAGDIIYWTAEGYNYDHADALSTAWGEAGTSVSPMFVGAGPGLKAGYKTDRIIRQVDFAPTVAILGGVRIPAQCEGAPAYQILTEEF